MLLGPYFAILNAFSISLLRNILGTGSILAFPGSIFGALLASFLYKKTKNIASAAFGEIIGTGIIGALVAFPLAKIFLGSQAAAFFFVVPFFVSSSGGSIIAVLILKSANMLNEFKSTGLEN